MTEGPEEPGTHPVGTSATLRLVSGRADLAPARRFVRSTLGGWGLAGEADDLELAVSEMVTNALLHGDGEIDVRVELRGDRVRLEVGDEGFGPEPIRFREPTSTGHGGWGLRVVDGLSDAWGAYRVPGRTLVWMDRRLPRD